MVEMNLRFKFHIRWYIIQSIHHTTTIHSTFYIKKQKDKIEKHQS